MAQKDDGGQAYPAAWGNPEQGGDYVPGMSLRDWFAGQALAGLLAGSPDADCGPMGYASDAYSMADAMIEKSKKGDTSDDQ